MFDIGVFCGEESADVLVAKLRYLRLVIKIKRVLYE